MAILLRVLAMLRVSFHFRFLFCRYLVQQQFFVYLYLNKVVLCDSRQWKRQNKTTKRATDCCKTKCGRIKIDQKIDQWCTGIDSNKEEEAGRRQHTHFFICHHSDGCGNDDGDNGTIAGKISTSAPDWRWHRHRSPGDLFIAQRAAIQPAVHCSTAILPLSRTVKDNALLPPPPSLLTLSSAAQNCRPNDATTMALESSHQSTAQNVRLRRLQFGCLNWIELNQCSPWPLLAQWPPVAFAACNLVQKSPSLDLCCSNCGSSSSGRLQRWTRFRCCPK